MSTTDLAHAGEHDGRAATTSATRLIGLSIANARLMLRNPITLAYGIITPLFPLGFVFASDGKEASVAGGISLVLTIAWLLPVYYNILSIIVSRREELVLKRLRTGEARDGELLLSMCLPGIAIAMVVAALAAAGRDRHRTPARVAGDLLPGSSRWQRHVRRTSRVDCIVDPQRRGGTDDKHAGLHAVGGRHVGSGRA